MEGEIRISWRRESRRFRVPVQTARGIFETRESILLTLADSCGNAGEGEIAPWQGFGCENLDDAENFLRAAQRSRIFAEDFFSALPAKTRAFPCTRHAFEAAKFFLENPEMRDAPEPEGFAQLISRLPGNAFSAEKFVAFSGSSKTRIFKIKIGLEPLAEELKFCRNVLRTATELGNVKIRFDANGAWNGADALDAISELNAFSALDFVEQPLAATSANDALIFSLPRERAEKIALDESLREPWKIPEDAAIVAVVKPLLVGDFLRLREWLGSETGARYVISTVFENGAGADVLRFLCRENEKNPRQLVCGRGNVWKN